MSEIDLGYMSIQQQKWSPGLDPETDYEEKRTDLDPEEIIVASQTIKIDYDYPLKNTFTFEHQTNNSNGFTRQELSKIIMQQYQHIYDEEEGNIGNPGNIPGLLNRRISEGPFGIWGHNIGDLILHTLYYKNGKYTLGIDS